MDVATGFVLFRQYRRNRAGVNGRPELASVCLICGSVHVDRDAGDKRKLTCRNCGFSFYRFDCVVCATPVDGRDPGNPPCSVCGVPRCACGACACVRAP